MSQGLSSGHPRNESESLQSAEIHRYSSGFQELVLMVFEPWVLE
ncbi:MAG: hypothetical protein ACTSUO_06125 [Candidatus Thorarchaeota archaeon]